MVEEAIDYKEALLKIETYKYDCILLDITLPGGSGLDLLNHLKEMHKKENVIIISARDSLEDKIAGLESGADDYLTKPFHLAELSARIRSVLRRTQQEGENKICFGNITIYPTDYKALIDGQPLSLNRKEFDILHYIMNRTDRLIDKVQMAEHVWGDHIDQSDNYDFIYAQIKNLRKKLKDAGATPELKAIYGVGYKFTLEN